MGGKSRYANYCEFHAKEEVRHEYDDLNFVDKYELP